jgi:hypothetical protein
MNTTYAPPRLHRLGSVAALTGTGDFPCIDLNGDGQGKTIGGPNDFVFRFLGFEIPLEQCATGS